MYIKTFLEIPSLYFWVIAMYPVQLYGVRSISPLPRHKAWFSTQNHHTIQFTIELRHVIDNGQKAVVWTTNIILQHQNKC